MSLSKFNQVEQGLKAAVERVPGLAGKVFVGMYAAPTVFPRAEIFAEGVAASDMQVSSRRLRHLWRFSVVLSHVSGDPASGYAEMKRLFWAVYDEIMADRTLGAGGDVFATPSTDSRLETGLTEDQRYGFRWWMQVSVKVSEL